MRKECIYCGIILEDEHEGSICECCLDERQENYKEDDEDES